MAKAPTNTRALRQFKLSLHLTDLQRKFIVGTVLGDGCLITSRSGKAARLQIRHNWKYQEYVEWKYSIVEKWVLTLKPNLYKDQKGCQLFFPKKSALQLYKLVEPHVVECMRYKFAAFNPVETDP